MAKMGKMGEKIEDKNLERSASNAIARAGNSHVSGLPCSPEPGTLC